MTAFFPNPLPDELLYSAVARYRDMLRLPNEKMLLESLFGSATMVASVEFTGHVDTWLERLPPGHPLTATAVIRSHTTLPYYRPFLPPDRGSDAEERLRSRGGASVCEILGVRASTVPNPPRLRFCPACATEDRECHGSPCWRRVHQLPGVFLCPRHLNVLWESSVSRSPGVHRHAFVSLAEAIHGHSTPLPVAADFAELLGTLARQSRWLLDETPIPPGLATLNARYRALLAERGWVRGKCQLRMAELRDAFVSGTGRRLLALLGCALPVRSHDAEADDWFARLLRRPRTAHHPLRHLLLMRFLGIEPAEFFALKPSRAPAALIPMPAAWWEKLTATFRPEKSDGEEWVRIATVQIDEFPARFRWDLRTSWFNWLDSMDGDLALVGELADELMELEGSVALISGSLLYLRAVDVHPAFAGQQIGARLVAHSLWTLSRSTGDVAVLLATPVQSEFRDGEPDCSAAAIRRLVDYYRRMGFERSRQRERFRDDVAVLMHARIGEFTLPFRGLGDLGLKG